MKARSQAGQQTPAHVLAAACLAKASAVTLPNGWKFRHSQRAEELQQDTVDFLTGVMERWRTASPTEETWARRHLGAPSIFGRVKFIIEQDGTVRVISIDGAPYIGLSAKYDPVYRGALEYYKAGGGQWPNFVSVTGPNVTSDDSLWVKTVTLSEARKMAGQLYLVRFNPKTNRARDEADLVHQSVVPVAHVNNRSYGTKLDLLEPFKWSDDEDPIKGPHAIKGSCGRGGHSVFFYGLDAGQRPAGCKSGDFVGEDRLKAFLDRNGGSAFKQRMYGPMMLSHCPGMCAVFCLDFAFDRKAGAFGSYRAIGGTWRAQRSMVVVPGEKTIIGPLRLPGRS